MSAVGERDYVLGTDEAETARLGLQHRVWRARVLDAWQRAGLASGQTAVDLGSGPGYATVDLAEMVGPTGAVHALERSGRFRATLEADLGRRGLTHVSVHACDLDEALWPAITADFVWCRWVATFVRDPRSLVTRLQALVKPGGTVVFHEYLDYAAWRLLPASPRFEAFVTAIMAAWRTAGGEPDIGRALPAWLEAAGFRVGLTRPLQEVVRPDEAFWQWCRAFVETGLARLVALGALPAPEAEETWRDFLAREQAPAVRMATPTVLEIIATRY